MEYVDILDVYSLYTKDACIVSLTVSIDRDIQIFTGTAVRHPLDKPNEKLAHMIAYARAYEALAYRLTKRAKGYVKHVDDVRLMSESQKSNPHLPSSILFDDEKDGSTFDLENFSNYSKKKKRIFKPRSKEA